MRARPSSWRNRPLTAGVIESTLGRQQTFLACVRIAGDAVMTDKLAHWTARPGDDRRGRADLRSGLAGLAGVVVMTMALLAGLAIAVVFAATLAVIMALASVLLALSALAWRMRPAAQRAVRVQRRAGHAWVAYGLEPPRR